MYCSSLLFLLLSLFAAVRSDCSTAVVSQISATDPNFSISGGSSFVTCKTSADLTVVDSTAVTPALNLGIAPEPASTGSAAFTGCSQYSAITETQYGTYSCKLKAQNTPGVQSSCYWATNTQGSEYQEIYFRFYGTNNTKMHIGYYTSGPNPFPDHEISLTFMSDADFHTYSIIYEKNYLRWYVDGVSLLLVTPQYTGEYSMPNLPGTLRVNYITGTEDQISVLGAYAGATSSIEVANMTYIPSSCGQSANFTTSSEDPTNPTKVNPWDLPCSKVGPSIVYSDSLASGVKDTSTAQVIFTSTYPTHSGSHAIAWAVEDSGTFGLAFGSPIALDKYWAIEMWINGGTQGGQQVTVTLTAGGSDLAFVNLGDYTNNLGIPQNKWMRIQIPFADFQIQSSLVDSFDGFYLSPAYANSFQGALNLDDIRLTNGSPCLGKETTIFGDSLNSDWVDKCSPAVAYNLENTSPVSTGTKSIYLQMYDNSLIYFHSNTGIDTNSYLGWSFDIDNEGVSNPDITVGITSNYQDYTSFPLSYFYGGKFPQSAATGTFVTVYIPFDAFGIYSGEILDGVQIKFTKTDYEGKLYVDNIQLVQSYQQIAASGEAGSESIGIRSATINASLVALLALLLVSTL